jgi:integrase
MSSGAVTRTPTPERNPMPDATNSKRTGTIHRYAPPKPGEQLGHYVVRCSAPDGSRPIFHLDPSPESPAAEVAARKVAEDISAELSRKGLGAARSRKRAVRDAAATASDGMEAWLALWIVERKRRGYTSTPENRSHYVEHIEPAIGPKHVRDWTADDLRILTRVLDAKVQDGKLSWKSAANVWGTATKMCKDASSSKLDALRVRTDNPAAGVLGPDRGARTVKQYLYPSEFLKFVSCEDVPLVWRRAVAIAIYVFPRAGELRVLRWEDVDLAHGTIHIHRARDRNTGEEKPTKTAVARRFSIEANLRPLLKAMHDARGANAHVSELPSERDMARGFRRWLAKAGVNRAELHTSSRTRKAMTFHDLRATGLTWLAVRGDDPLKIMQRAGHVDFATTQGYIREAEAVREGFGDVFPPLPQSIVTSGGPSGGDTPKGPKEMPSSPPVAAVAEQLSQHLPQATQVLETIAGRTGLEPAASGVTGRRYNQLNYRPVSGGARTYHRGPTSQGFAIDRNALNSWPRRPFGRMRRGAVKGALIR